MDLYLECATGISGDMTVASLLDLGADEKVLNEVLASIPLHGFKTEITRVKKAGIDCCDFNVIFEEENHDHDMEYLFGHEHGHSHQSETAVNGGEHSHHDEAAVNGCEHTHEHNHEHHHEHEHTHDGHEEHHHHHHAHRGMAEITEIIHHTKMTDGARALALKVFDIIADSEAKAHGIPKDQVHFHEVGAVDSIVDVIAFAVCFDNLGVNRVYVPKIFEGSGTVRCQHGILPIPVPAVMNIAASYNLKLSVSEEKGEFITPTGAAFVAAIRTDSKLPAEFSIKKIGLGAGKRTYERPSILRALLIESDEVGDKCCGGNENTVLGDRRPLGDKCCAVNESSVVVNNRPLGNGCCADNESSAVGDGSTLGECRPNSFCQRSETTPDASDIIKIESNIDDCTGEQLGFVMEELFAAGARDVFYTPCIMKKNRPAYVLNVICDYEQLSKMEEIIFTNTSTIGFRRYRVERSWLARKASEVQTEIGTAKVKCVFLGEKKRFYPEYESVAKIAREKNLSYKVVYDIIVAACATEK